MTQPGPWQAPHTGPPEGPPVGAPDAPPVGALADTLQQAPNTAQDAIPQGVQATEPVTGALVVLPHPGVLAQARRHRLSPARVINVMLVIAVAIVATATLTFFMFSLGASVFLVCGALALIPLAICLLTLNWIGRWEPEPRAALIFAFCWGAGMSVVAALVVGSWVQPLLLAGSNMSNPQAVSSLVQAPLVEETCKCLGILVLFFLRRRTFDGPVDGVVYAGTIAAGFAFTENILYFGSTVAPDHELGSGLFAMFVTRGLMSPFAHVMFTATCGALVGFAARYGGTAKVIGAWVVGLVPAMALHALWNTSSLVSENFFVIYFVLQVPIFILYAAGIVGLHYAETRLTRKRLGDYVPSGWFHPQEVPMLATGTGRRRALAWANSFGAGRAMKDFIRVSTRLAFTRQRILLDARQRPSTHAAARTRAAQAYELALLQQATAARSSLLAQHGAYSPQQAPL